MYKQLPLIMVLWFAAGSACTRGSGGFMSVFGGGGGKSASKGGDTDLGPDPSNLPKLSRADLADQLKGIAVMPGAPSDNGKGEAGGDYLLCAAEQTKIDQARVQGNQLEILYEANADACPSSLPTKAGTELSGGTGFASFSYVLGCGAAAASLDLKAMKAAVFFRHQSFNFSGAPEGECLRAGGGKASYRLKTTKSYGYDVKTTGKKTGREEVKSSLEVSGAGGSLCEVEREAAGAIIVRDCVYRSALRLVDRPDSGAPSTMEAVTIAKAHDLRAKGTDRFYSSGTMDLVINNWKGKVEFRSGVEPPIAEMSDGRAVVSFKLNGEFTNEAR